MKDFIITTDNTTDLPLEYLKENNLRQGYLGFSLDGQSYGENYEEQITPKQFYEKMRAGAMPTTMQMNPAQAKALFVSCFDAGYDVLHITFSSGLSGSYNSCSIAQEELAEERPDHKLIVVDSLCASMGEGLLVHYAVQQKKQGKTMEEIAAWLEENKLHLCHYFTVDDLNHLYRGGRVSKMAAVAGTLIGIKPVLHVDNNGKLIPVGKVRGRKQSLNALVDYMGKKMGSFADKNQTVFISHGDCLEDAMYVKEQIEQRFGKKEFLINTIGPTIGAHSGPGTVALFFLGDER